DQTLGRVLVALGACDMWQYAMLLVCTDHGLMLGEHDWLGKNVMPFYDETIHTPLFLWDPVTATAGQRRDQLVQTIDIGPTLLDAFGLEPTRDMQGRSLRAVLAGGSIHDSALFGVHGGHACVTDGRYVYMRACTSEDNQPLYDYTLMPNSIPGRIVPVALTDMDLVEAFTFTFTKGVPVLRIPALAPNNPAAFGSLLFDLETDPGQTVCLTDPDLEHRMATLLVQ